MAHSLSALVAVLLFTALGCATSNDYRTLYEQNLVTSQKDALKPYLSEEAKKAIAPLTATQLDQLTASAKQFNTPQTLVASGDVKSNPSLAAVAEKLTAADVGVLAQAPKADSAKAAKDAVDQQKFAGINFGAGIGIAADLGGSRRVNDASVVNGVVRVNESARVTPRVLLETHYFFTPDNDFLGSAKKKEWGWGPFFGLQSSGNQVIESVGFGMQLGFKVPDKGSSFNFGLGALVDPKAKVLGDGIKEGQALPAGETEVRFKKEAKWSLLVEFSFTF